MTVLHRDAKSLFLEAVELRSPAEWGTFLDQHCGDDPDLRRRLEVLLRAHRGHDSLFDREPLSLTVNHVAEPVGSSIGPFKLREVLGEGGMGVVYAAEQEQPLRRKVALKVIKPGMDTRQVVARFEAERQALALMDDPHIARVLDAGATDSGRPYFVMELVKGIPITTFCDERRLTTRERLKLFIDVCHAIQHAHQKGIIHRDIKPSNILVTLHEGTPVVKVIDFGVAKALGQQLIDKTLYTGFAQLIGTPMYMSPEQAGLSAVDVDTRSDVYSLGVVLYELLTGTTPIDRAKLADAGYDELCRIIRDEDSQRPSARVSTMHADALSTICERRRIDPARISRHLRGELDWIATRALEKNRGRRYESPSALATDVQHYLDDQPVAARPPSPSYLVRKFLRRHRTAVVVGVALLAAALVAGSSAGWAALDRKTRDAEIRGAVKLAWEEADRWEQQGRWKEAVAAAKRGVDLLGQTHGDDPLRDHARRRRNILELLLRLQDVRMELALQSKGGAAADVADALYAAAFRDYGLDVDTLEPDEVVSRMPPQEQIRKELAGAFDDWAVLRRSWRRRNNLDDGPWQRVLAVARAADPTPEHNRLRDLWSRTDFRTRKEPEGPKEDVATLVLDDLHPYSFRLLAQTVNLGEANRRLRAYQRQHPDDFWINSALGGGLAMVASTGGPGAPAQMDEASGFLRAALAARPDNPIVLADLGNALVHGARPEQTMDEGIAYLKRAIEIHPDAFMWQAKLGNALVKRGALDEAATAFRNATRIAPRRADYHYSLGKVLMRQHLWDEADAAFTKAVEIVPGISKSLSPIYNEFAWLLATAEQRDPRRALRFAEKAVANDPTTGHVWNTLGAAQYRNGDLTGALESFQKSMELRSGGDSFDWFFLAMIHNRLGNRTEAEEWCDKAARWAAQHAATDEDLIRIRNEATALLDVRPASAELPEEYDQRTFVKEHRPVSE